MSHVFIGFFVFIVIGSFARAAAAPSGFVSALGTQLILNGKPYRPVGYNQYRLTSMPGGYICDGSYGPVTDAQLNRWLDDMKNAGATIVRTWFFQSYYWGSPNRWEAFDRLLNAAAARGMKVVPVLVNHWPNCEPSAGPKNLAFYENGYTQPNSYGYPLSFREYARTVAAHYANEPTVAYLQLVNEAETPSNGSCSPETEQAGARALRAFADDMTGVIKSVAPNHLVSLGTIGEGNCGTAGQNYRYVHAGAVDICAVHDYNHATQAMPGDQWNGMQVRLDQCNGLNKPIVVDEAGIVADVSEDGSSSGVITPTTLSRRARFFNAKITAQFAGGVDGYLIWEKILEDSTFNLSSGRYGVGPGDPTEAVTRNWSRTYYGLGGDGKIYRWGGFGWTQITNAGGRDHFHFVSENEIYVLGGDGRIYKWNGSSFEGPLTDSALGNYFWFNTSGASSAFGEADREEVFSFPEEDTGLEEPPSVQ